MLIHLWRMKEPSVDVVILDTLNGKLIWCLSSSPSLLVGISIPEKSLDVVRPASQKIYCHVDVIHLLP